jgi:hypothetical protein
MRRHDKHTDDFRHVSAGLAFGRDSRRANDLSTIERNDYLVATKVAIAT